MDIRLRDASADDSGFVYALKKAALGPYVEATWGWDEDLQLALHADRFATPHGMIVVVDEVDGGWLAVSRHADRIVLVSIYLLPVLHGRGIGTSLIRSVLADAAEGGMPVVLQVLKVNQRARALYERLGFEVSDGNETHWRMIARPRTGDE